MFQFRKSRPAPEPKKAAVGQIEAKKPLPSSSGQSVSESDESMSSLADSSVSTSSSDREKQIFTRAQVAAHCYQHDLWVIYKTRVLDCTKFLEEHPGGVHLLMDHAGGDVTNAFNAQKAHKKAFRLLKTLQIGVLSK